jgi:tetratricopeptide (TPR) repeat protein
MTLLKRLWEHRFFHIVGAYLAGGWIALELVDHLVDRRYLPELVYRLTLLWYVAGVFATVLIAWHHGAQGRQRAPRSEVAALAVLAIVALGFSGSTVFAAYTAWRSGGLAPARSLLATGKLPEQATLLMADFRSLSGDTVLAAVVTEALRVDLGRSPVVGLAQPGRVRAALARMERDPGMALDGATAAEVARREGLAGVVTGEVAGLGRGYVLTARIQTADDGAVLAAVRETAANDAGLLPAIDRLSGQLRQRIGESARSLRAAAPLEQVTTASLDALRRYSQAMGTEAAGDLERTIALLEEAVELDPGFAMAHRKLAVLLLSWGRDRDRQIESLTRAHENAHRLTERERYHAAAAYHATVSGDDRRAIRAYQALTELDPRDLTAWNNLGYVHMRLGEPAPAARAFERALEVDSMHVSALYNLVLARADQGRMGEARGELVRVEARVGDRPGTLLLRYVLALFDDDLVSAEREVGAALERFGHDPTLSRWFGSARANILLLAGRVADAELQLRALEDQARDQGLGPAELEAAIIRARIDIVFRGDTARGLARLDDVLARFQEVPPYDRPYRAMAAAAAQARSPAQVRALIQDFDTALGTAPGAEPRRIRGYLDAKLAVTEGRLTDMEAFMPLGASPRDCPHCVHAWLGSARDAGAQHAGATAHYLAYLGRRVGSQILDHDPWWLVPVLLRMAELLEAEGQGDRAEGFSARAAALWAHADPELAMRTLRRGAADH